MAQNPAEAEVGGIAAQPFDHVCALYRGRAERDRLMLPFLKDGLEAGDACLCLATDGESANLASLLGRDHDVSRLIVTEPRNSYLRRGVFDPEWMLAFVEDWARTCFETDGRDFARLVADMSWGLPMVSQPFIEDLSAYEARVTLWARSYPQSLVCMYDLDHFGGNVIFAVMQAHPKVWMSGVIVENPYYLRLDEGEAVS